MHIDWDVTCNSIDVIRSVVLNYYSIVMRRRIHNINKL